ncbi:uncharacterized protein LOC113351430 [Papaver somniferum]|uniref:uncharacterized protein LOC113351430 n=1 Tax=Papaver somniferum TaxID=3469 RepID=UPI000E6FB54A|nr:uncharacterized protein LOC113351430 [Papaver somniferum]
METGFQKYHDMKLTPLNIQLTDLYEKIIKDLIPPCPLPADTRDKRDKSKYCKFHKDYGHKTENCRALKIEVQQMIDARKLHEYVKKDFGKGPGQFGTTHVINVSHARIHLMTRRASEDESRRNLRKLKEWYLINYIDFVSGNGAEIWELWCKNIEFSEADMIGVYAPHNDAIVITAWIGMFRVHRILVDTRSSVSVLFSGDYSSMNLPHDLIEEDENPIIGFSGEVTKAIGKVKIPITVDDKSVIGNFLLLDCRAPYNAIVGRDWLHENPLPPESYVGEDATEPPTVEKLIEVQIGDEKHKTTFVEAYLPAHERDGLVTLLRANADVFAWSFDEMPGIDPNVSCHRLNID